jgi:hypothetical protein
MGEIVIADFGIVPDAEKVAVAKRRLAELQRRYEREAAPLLRILAEEWASEKPSDSKVPLAFVPLP